MWAIEDYQRDQAAAQIAYESEMSTYYADDASEQQDRTREHIEALDQAINSGSLEEKINVLLERARQNETSALDSLTTTPTPEILGQTFNVSRFHIWVTIPLSSFAITFLLLHMILPKRHSIFAFGGALQREVQATKRRERWVWVVCIGLVVGIAASVLASKYFGA